MCCIELHIPHYSNNECIHIAIGLQVTPATTQRLASKMSHAALMKHQRLLDFLDDAATVLTGLIQPLEFVPFGYMRGFVLSLTSHLSLALGIAVTFENDMTEGR
ncbi:hypothetical protein TgHK011_003151 [Trichoderma gracile]|nr:hypothetical protein TgHK011_003151 [Trichoderma gracile]